MSKFKKKAAKLFKMDLDESLEEQLKDYLENVESQLHDDPWGVSSNNSAKDNAIALSSNGSEFYDSLVELYVNDLVYLTRNAKPKNYYAISGSGPAWYFEPHTRTFVKTACANNEHSYYGSKRRNIRSWL